MAPLIKPVETHRDIPSESAVVVIGGGIVGLSTALSLAERGIAVVVLEKGRIAGEQSSRNLGWIRKLSRLPADIPLARHSERLWQEMPQRTGADVGYRQNGIMFVARNEAELAVHQKWLRSAEPFALGARLLTPAQIEAMVPGGAENWAGGIYCQSDGSAEPTLASSAIANAAIRKGVTIVENCAARSLVKSGGRLTGVATERGEIRCEQVVLAGGVWSRRFLGNLGISFATLPVSASVIRTAPMEGPTSIAVGAPDFSFRKRVDGGFIITQRGALNASLTLDHARIGYKYTAALRANWSNLRIRFGREFFTDMALSRRWRSDRPSPFERVRTLDPVPSQALVGEAMRNLIRAYPAFADSVILETWAGTIDITPDSLPVISPVPQLPGLTLATGFSGHGFGTAPAAGELAADLVLMRPPAVDPSPYSLSRF